MSPWDWGQQIIWDTKWTLLYKECLRSCSPLHSRVTVFWVGRVWCVSFPSSLLDVPSTLGCCFCISSLCPPCAPATPHFDHSLGRPPQPLPLHSIPPAPPLHRVLPLRWHSLQSSAVPLCVFLMLPAGVSPSFCVFPRPFASTPFSAS